MLFVNSTINPIRYSIKLYIINKSIWADKVIKLSL